MKRRQFMFNSLASAMFFNSIFSIRRAEAQEVQKMKAFFFVEGGSYPYPEDFFPSQTGSNFTLRPILEDFQDLKSDMVIINGISSRDSGSNPKGNNHIRAMGKVLTAKDVIQIGDTFDALPGGISADQVIAKGLGVGSLEVLVHTKAYNHMRARPFAIDRNKFKFPIQNVGSAWDKVFKGFQADPSLQTDAAKEERLRKLSANQSELDSLVSDLTRFRKELVGVEKIKMDAHAAAIRETEKVVAAEIKRTNEETNDTNLTCSVPSRPSTSGIPNISKAHFDIMYAALACDRIGVGGIMFGYSSIQWMYEWISLGLNDDIHDMVYHKRSTERARHIKASRWNWNELAKFAKKLKDTPDGTSNLLNNTLIYGTSHFGAHHTLKNIPIVLLGNAQGKLTTGQSIKHTSTNAKSLTSAINLCGVSVNGMGDEPSSGKVPGVG